MIAQVAAGALGVLALTNAATTQAAKVQAATVQATTVQAATAHVAADGRETLPDSVVPVRYDLSVHPDAAHMRFTAEVRIAIDARRPVPAVVLNAKGLDFQAVTLEDGRRATVTLDPVLERAALAFPGGVTTGRHVLKIAYGGPIGRGTLGFFAMDYAGPNGPRQVLATNFEPSAERQFMPSWDEPGRKAVFHLSVDAPADRMAISNMPIASQTPLAGGLTRVSFQPTPPMASYLLFLAIGDYERITAPPVDGVTVGVVVPRGETERGRYALSQATRLLGFYDQWFGVHYPLPKLDLVAAPGAIEGGSMENWGSIFYGQEHLLFDPQTGTAGDRQLVFTVVAHEMAHQWFGDLVTMQWWNNLWLNEGFARWMQTTAADRLHPEWSVGVQALRTYDSGMRADAAPGSHPVEQPVRSAAEAALAFDDITYDKGAAVIHMIEGYLGPDAFRDGVGRYIRAHAFANAQSDDLWSALQAQAGKPVNDLADAFTRRAGLPLLTVEAETPGVGGERLTLSQGRFEADHATGAPVLAASPWPLPLPLQSAAGGAAAAVRFDQAKGVVTGPAPAPVIANAGRTSYTRVLYAATVFPAVAQAYGALPPVDQIGALLDGWALAQSGYAPGAEVMELVSRLPPQADALVWMRATPILAGIDQAYAPGPQRARFRSWARATLAPVMASLGWQAQPGESAGAALLRPALLLALSRFDDPAVIAEGRRRFADEAAQPAEARRIALAIVARHADAATFDRLLARLRAEDDPLAKQHILEALAHVADPALAQQVLDLVTRGDIPAGVGPEIVSLTSEAHPELAWRWVETNLARPDVAIDETERMTLAPEIAENAYDAGQIDRLQAFARAHLPAAAARPVADAVSQIRSNLRLRTQTLPDIDRWLARRTPTPSAAADAGSRPALTRARPRPS